MDKLRTAAGLSAALLVAACVTVNIYFPAAAAEKAADKIIQDVWGSQPGQEPAQPPAERSPSRDSGSADPPRSVLDRLVPAAQAAADIDISTPAIERLTASMKSRHPLLDPYFNSGAVGLTANGLLELRDLKAVALAERTRVRELVAQQNQARSALYREIASANGHPEWEPRDPLDLRQALDRQRSPRLVVPDRRRTMAPEVAAPFDPTAWTGEV